MNRVELRSFPYRTRKVSPSAPSVPQGRPCGRVGCRRASHEESRGREARWRFFRGSGKGLLVSGRKVVVYSYESGILL